MDAKPARAALPAGRRLRRRWGAWACAAVLAVAAPPALEAQAPPRRAWSALEGSLALTSLHGDASWMGGVTGLLGLGHRLSVGGGGMAALRTTRLPGSGPGSDLELRVAFGGLVANVRVMEAEGTEVWARVLAGAGNAKLDLAVARTQIAADNFGVLIPEIGATLAVAGPLRAGAAVGYRATFGVEDLPGVGALDLRGFSARILLAVRHR